MKKRLRLKSWVKDLMIITVMIITFIFLAHLLCNKSDDFEKWGKKCDAAKGGTCSYTEVRNYMVRGR
jgi:hypothetical protein